MIEISINNSVGFPLDKELCQKVVRQILGDYGIQAGEMSIAIVDDPTIHLLNRQHLEHDYPTDVLSFLLEDEPEAWEGEVVVSADTAAISAIEVGSSTSEELLLYIIHGTLHLVGLEDHLDEDRVQMRERERHYLRLLGYDALPEGTT